MMIDTHSSPTVGDGERFLRTAGAAGGARVISFTVIGTAFNFPRFWVKEVGQTGTTARHNTQNGQKCCV